MAEAVKQTQAEVDAQSATRSVPGGPDEVTVPTGPQVGPMSPHGSSPNVQLEAWADATMNPPPPEGGGGTDTGSGGGETTLGVQGGDDAYAGSHSRDKDKRK
jgi:hypothetical protein